MLEIMGFLTGGEHSDTSCKLAGFNIKSSVATATSASRGSFSMSLLLAVGTFIP